jgi:hypothetical protein
MKVVVFILVIVFATTAVKADGVQTPVSKKRSHHNQAEINVEDMIRAEEDPNFPQVLKERERQKREEKVALLAYQKQRDAEVAANLRAQHQFFKEEEENAAREAGKVKRHQINELKTWAQQQENYRKQYIAEKNKQIDKLNSERMARYQRESSLQRMPASSN